jgi:16S rRNA A1518/A1519 N6-dimethyltransferase RsmA/KsgA/DIM1 with predicted DNA glycosylase/AP lyase activity
MRTKFSTRVASARVSQGLWNHNIHYHDILLAAIPPGARLALDVGWGEGIMTPKLQTRIEHVTAIDIDPGRRPCPRA